MGNKAVCFDCKKSFSFFKTEIQNICPKCKGEVLSIHIDLELLKKAILRNGRL